MTCTFTKKAAAILLSIAMVFTMMPLLGGEVYADTEEISVTTEAELKTALQSDATAKITLANDIECTNDISAKGTKILDGNGNKITFSDGYLDLSPAVDVVIKNIEMETTSTYYTFMLIKGDVNVTIESGYFESKTEASIISISSGSGKLTINGGTFLQSGTYQVLHSQSGSNPACTVEINDGVFAALNDDKDCCVFAAPYSDLTKLTVNGGTFVGKGQGAFGFWNNGSAVGHADKNIGAGKVVYVDGVKSTATNLARKNIGDNYCVQVGNSDAEFVQVALNDDSAGLATLGGKCTTSGYFLANKPMYLIANSDTHKRFQGWSRTNGTGTIDDTSAPITTFVPTSVCTIKASYQVEAEYDIETTITPTGGGRAPVADKAYAGDTVSLTTQGYAGRVIKSVTVMRADTATQVSVTRDGDTFSWVMPASKVFVTVAFTQPNTISASSSGHGTVSVDKTKVAAGDTVKVTATPDSGYRLSYFQGLTYQYTSPSGAIRVEDVGETREFVVPETSESEKTIYVTANFEPIPKYTVGMGSMTNGSITVNKISANPGESVTVTTKPAAGYKAKSVTAVWSGGSIDITLDENGIGSFEMPEGNVIISATFEVAPHYNITAVASPSNGGTVQVDKTSWYAGGIVEVTAKAKEGYYLKALELHRASDDSLISKIEGGSFAMPSEAVTVVAVFGAYEKITVTTEAELKAALEKTTPAEIIVANDIECTDEIYAKGIKLLDGNGNTITYSNGYLALNTAENVVIRNVEMVATSTDYTLMEISSDVNVTIESGYFESKTNASIIFISSGSGKLTINGGVFLQSGTYQVLHSQSFTNPAYSVEINDGVFAALNDDSNCCVFAAPYSDLTKLTVNGGTFIGKGQGAFGFWRNGSAVVHADKNIGEGKVAYVEGVKSTAMNLSNKIFGNNYFVQVGEPEDFEHMNLYIEGYPLGDASLCMGQYFNMTGGYVKKDAPVFVKYRIDNPEARADWSASNGIIGDELAGYKLFYPTGMNAALRVKFSKGARFFTDEDGNDVDIVRIAGTSRYDTSRKAAGKFLVAADCEKYENVIVAYGGNFPDALGGGYLAKVKNAPIILVDEKNETAVFNDIKANMAADGTVYILGGTGVVSTAFEKKCKSQFGDSQVKRLAGTSRYETNLEILKACGTDFDTILVCTGSNYPDSLSASAAGIPIFLVNGDTLTANQKAYLNSVKAKVTKVYAVGGTGAVSDKVVSAVKSNLNSPSVERLAGASRYETSTLVAKEFFPSSEVIVLAVASNFPDGLSGGPIAMALNAPIVLVTNSSYNEAKKYASDAGVSKAVVFGGPTLISDSVANKVIGKL